MDYKKYDANYLNETFALCVLGFGMVVAAFRAAGAHGWLFLLFSGLGLAYYSAFRLGLYNKYAPKKDKTSVPR